MADAKLVELAQKIYGLDVQEESRGILLELCGRKKGQVLDVTLQEKELPYRTAKPLLGLSEGHKKNMFVLKVQTSKGVDTIQITSLQDFQDFRNIVKDLPCVNGRWQFVSYVPCRKSISPVIHSSGLLA